MRVLVTGGRDFALPDEVGRILNTLHAAFTITELAHGGAEGADELAKLWACSMGIEPKEFEVTQHQWDLYGDRAGNMRNSRMLREFKPDCGVSFPGGNGTADMTIKLLESGVPTFVGRYINIERSALKWEFHKGRLNG